MIGWAKAHLAHPSKLALSYNNTFKTTLARYKVFMESVMSALKPVSDLIEILSGEEHVTASGLKPMSNHMHNEVLAEKGDTTLKSDIQIRIS